ncbi:hypothetical protein AB1L88_15530 [Tautonia sp. JC769]|uniref:hypothetical protein n=1 Tax=Tautonia sp. JC769 TaxID=3232135 RepID=UPI00345764DC
MKTTNLTALTRKLIASKAVAILDGIGSYDCDYELVARDAAAELGVSEIDAYDLDDITDRIGDLVVLRVEAIEAGEHRGPRYEARLAGCPDNPSDGYQVFDRQLGRAVAWHASFNEAKAAERTLNFPMTPSGR